MEHLLSTEENVQPRYREATSTVKCIINGHSGTIVAHFSSESLRTHRLVRFALLLVERAQVGREETHLLSW